jgi:hypothetical protein
VKMVGLHIRDTKNAGDRHSSPLDYFEFPGDVECADMRTWDGRADAVIYGGGSITAAAGFVRRGLTIAWGVGHHERNEPWAAAMRAEHERARALCDLYSPRDAVDGFDVVPCASCMHPVFDEPVNPTRKTVCYSAARRVDVSDGESPHMTNEDGTIEDAVRFLASAEEVVTSSYHGAYWAGLLGLKVRIAPWGSKFDYLPRMPLAECRARNRAAHRRVLEEL